MKLLIISYSFPPRSYGAATLMYNLCKYLPKESFQVITPGFELATKQGGYDPKYVLDCYTIRLPVQGRGIKAEMMFLLFSIVKGFILNNKKEFDCLLSVYPPEHDLYAAYILHKFTRKPLVIYMHDLFSEVKRSTRLYRIWCHIERRIFSTASVILVTNERFRHYYLKRGISNVITLPSCIDLSFTEKADRSLKKVPPTRQGKLRVVFTGGVYPANEDAILFFLKTIEQVKDVEVIFATADEKSFLKNVSTGFIPKQKCYELQRSADVLLLPLSFKCPYPEEIECAFPTKALEYLAACKPILAIVPKETFSHDFVEKNNLGVVVTELSEQKILDAIEKLKNTENRKVFSENAAKIVSLYDARIQAKHLYNIIQKVISGFQKNKKNIATEI